MVLEAKGKKYTNAYVKELVARRQEVAGSEVVNQTITQAAVETAKVAVLAINGESRRKNKIWAKWFTKGHKT